MTPRMLRVADVAARWSCHRDTVYDLIARGVLEAKRFGPKMIRVPLAAVEAMEACQGQTGEPNYGRPPTASGTSAHIRVVGATSEARVNEIADLLRRR